MSNEDDQARVEGSKLLFDAIKHLTTLNVGSILVLVGLLEKVFTRPLWRGILAISFAGFALSILAAMRLLVFLSAHVARKGESEDIPKGFYRLMAYGFFIGTVCLATFVILNLFPDATISK